MLKIVITGSTGLIGSRIVELLKGDFEFIQLIEGQIDIREKDGVWKVLKKLDFDILFHLAAYTNVDGAEKEKEKAQLVNVKGTKNVLEAVSQKKKKLIYVSTDFVFDGIRRIGEPPYYEYSKPHPISYYAQTKYEGEKLVKNHAMILRFSYPYRSFFEPKQDFMRRLKSYLEQKRKLQLMTDTIITPTFVDDIAYATKYLFNNFAPEIFHVVGRDSLSPYDAGKLIAKTFTLDESLVEPTTYNEYSKNKANRPQFSEIKTKKNNFYRMKSFEEGLEEIKTQILSSNF